MTMQQFINCLLNCNGDALKIGNPLTLVSTNREETNEKDFGN
jgi:hypothetical protein